VKDSYKKAESFKEFQEISQIRQRLLQRTKCFKELVKFFQIFERFTNFFPQEKIFARTTKNFRKPPRMSSCSCKIGPAKKSEAKIQFRSDEESAEKGKEFQPLDFAQRTDNRRIREKVHKD
jgi:hypothetical protein